MIPFNVYIESYKYTSTGPKKFDYQSTSFIKNHLLHTRVEVITIEVSMYSND